MEYSRHEKCFLNTYDFCFAKKIQELIPTLTREHCYGCMVDHPSQREHSCLLFTELECLEQFFVEAYDKISLKDVISTVKPCSIWECIDDCEMKLKKEVYDKLSQDRSYCEKNKPKPSKVYQLVEALIKTEDRFS